MRRALRARMYVRIRAAAEAAASNISRGRQEKDERKKAKEESRAAFLRGSCCKLCRARKEKCVTFMRRLNSRVVRRSQRISAAYLRPAPSLLLAAAQ